eukprot:TRINITY_DN14742_c0_g1_i1.p1 TRINITY_DN14742_c0_g1~~TRINITY_DN14742_c0_g1_i1.p1  ORF type:complete len:477 (+),score=108.34 TRINITY_DN14742_c0_g1_i1:143-1573(+)
MSYRRLGDIGLSSSISDLARKGDNGALERKLQGGANINLPSKRSSLKRTPLHVAVKSKHCDTVDFLLHKGAAIDAIDDAGDTPLHYAAGMGLRDIAEVLLTQGADHTIRNKSGCLPVHLANGGRHTEIQEMLRDRALSCTIDFKYKEGQDWLPFDETAARTCGFELGEGANFTVAATSSGLTFVVDFVQMIQINATSWMARSICWKVQPAGQWRMPAQPFQALIIDPQKMAPYAWVLQSRGFSVPVALDAPPGPERTPIPSRRTSGPSAPVELPLVVEQLEQIPGHFQVLEGEDPECQTVIRDFLLGMERQGPGAGRDVAITCVHRIVHENEREQTYEEKKVERALVRGSANEVRAWHGTRLENIAGIVTGGFTLNPWTRNGNLYGHGVYFAPLRRAYTATEFATEDPQGDRHVLLCKVILGTSEVVSFESQQSRPSSALYDTGTDNRADPTRFIVWLENLDSYILPTHVLSFKLV